MTAVATTMTAVAAMTAVATVTAMATVTTVTAMTAAMTATVTAAVTAAVAAATVAAAATAFTERAEGLRIPGVDVRRGCRSCARCGDRSATGDQNTGSRRGEETPRALCSHGSAFLSIVSRTCRCE
jgi:hypothetical protein